MPFFLPYPEVWGKKLYFCIVISIKYIGYCLLKHINSSNKSDTLKPEIAENRHSGLVEHPNQTILEDQLPKATYLYTIEQKI